jgi:CO/xanthine dehydrogenase FAD-binding subunit
MLYNARTYEKPRSIEEARQLLQQSGQKALVLYDDLTTVDPDRRVSVEAAVDLSALGLSGITHEGSTLRIGATTPLQTIADDLNEVAGGLLAACARQTGGWNARHAASVGGLLVGGSASAPLRLALDALGAQVKITGHDSLLPLTALSEELVDEILLAVVLDLPDRAIGTAYEQVGRTPRDLPIINAAAVVRPTGTDSASARISVGGVLEGRLLRLDLAGANPNALDSLLDNLDGSLLDDALGSAEYRQAMALVLSRRALTTALTQVG